MFRACRLPARKRILHERGAVDKRDRMNPVRNDCRILEEGKMNANCQVTVMRNYLRRIRYEERHCY
jgi:hypothetical protein